MNGALSHGMMPKSGMNNPNDINAMAAAAGMSVQDYIAMMRSRANPNMPNASQGGMQPPSDKSGMNLGVGQGFGGRSPMSDGSGQSGGGGYPGVEGEKQGALGLAMLQDDLRRYQPGPEGSNSGQMDPQTYENWKRIKGSVGAIDPQSAVREAEMGQGGRSPQSIGANPEVINKALMGLQGNQGAPSAPEPQATEQSNMVRFMNMPIGPQNTGLSGMGEGFLPKHLQEQAAIERMKKKDKSRGILASVMGF